MRYFPDKKIEESLFERFNKLSTEIKVGIATAGLATATCIGGLILGAALNPIKPSTTSTPQPVVYQETQQSISTLVSESTRVEISMPTDKSSSFEVLDGRWEGPVNQPSVPYYTTILTLTDCKPNAMCGSVEYPELSCGGKITFLNIENDKYRLRENITYGTGNCINEVMIDLQQVDGNSWKALYYWNYLGGSGVAEAILTKSK